MNSYFLNPNVTKDDLISFYTTTFVNLDNKTRSNPNYYVSPCTAATQFAGFLVDERSVIARIDELRLNALERTLLACTRSLRETENLIRGRKKDNVEYSDSYNKFIEAVNSCNDLIGKPINIHEKDIENYNIVLVNTINFALVLSCLFNPESREETVEKAINCIGVLNEDNLYSIGKKYGIYGGKS